MNIPDPQIMGIQMGTKMRNGEFLENGSKHSDYISKIYVDRLPKWNCIGGTFRKIMVRAQRGRNAKFDFVEIHADLFVVRYSVTNNGLSNSNRFNFYGYVVSSSDA